MIKKKPSREKIDLRNTPIPPEPTTENKAKALSTKANNERDKARSNVKKTRDVPHQKHGGHLRRNARKSEPLRLTEEASAAWEKLKPKRNEFAEPVEESKATRDEKKRGCGSAASSPRSHDEHLSNDSRTRSPEDALKVSSPRLARQSPPKGSLRMNIPEKTRGQRESLPVMTRVSPRKGGRMMEAYLQDVEKLRRHKANTNALKKVSQTIASADVHELHAARIQSKEDYAACTRRIAQLERELKTLRSERLVIAGTIEKLNMLIEKDPEAMFPADADWDVLGEAPQHSGRPSRDINQHRRVQTDKT